MTEIEKLEEQLEKAKLLEKQNKLNLELEDKVSKYKGKCYATHNLGRGWHKHLECTFRRVKDVFLENDKILFNIETISYFKDKLGHIKYEYTESKGTNDCIFSWERFKYEISEKQFLSALKRSEILLEKISDELREGLQTPYDYFDGFQQTEDRTFEELLSKSNADLIILPTTNVFECCGSIAEMLGWYHHPLLFCNKYLLNSKLSKDILESIINRLYNESINWPSLYNRDSPRIKALQNFLESVKWNNY